MCFRCFESIPPITKKIYWYNASSFIKRNIAQTPAPPRQHFCMSCQPKCVTATGNSPATARRPSQTRWNRLTNQPSSHIHKVAHRWLLLLPLTPRTTHYLLSCRVASQLWCNRKRCNSWICWQKKTDLMDWFDLIIPDGEQSRAVVTCCQYANNFPPNEMDNLIPDSSNIVVWHQWDMYGVEWRKKNNYNKKI